MSKHVNKIIYAIELATINQQQCIYNWYDNNYITIA